MAQRDANPPNDTEPKRRRLSRGVWVRLAIYLPLLGFFGWQAGQKALQERDAADDAFRDGVRRTLAWFEADPARCWIDHAVNAEMDRILAAYPG